MYWQSSPYLNAMAVNYHLTAGSPNTVIKAGKTISMNPIEGQISIDVYLHETKGRRVEIVSSRPLRMVEILIGKRPEEALSIIPLMYNICGTAHSRAALMSIQQCLQFKPEPAMEIARDMLLLAEIAREHLMRIFLDWPKLFAIDAGGHKPAFFNQLTQDLQAASFFRGRAFALDSQLDFDRSTISKLIAGLQQYLHQHVFSISPSDWLAAEDKAFIPQWSGQAGTVASQAVHRIYDNGWAAQGKTDCRHLPELDSRQLLEQFDKAGVGQFSARPTWQGHCFETGALSRQRDYPLVQSLHREFQNALITRWMARLVELARIPQQLSDLLDQIEGESFNGSAEEQDNSGVAQIESARGRLIHRVETRQGVIRNYQILAPTEWNFHPQGPLAQALLSLNTNDETEFYRLAHLMINAIDPCVSCELRMH